jgi:predicted aspartyl protease
MSSSHRYSPLPAIIVGFFFCVSSLAQQFSVKFKVDNSKIIVPVRINEAGPYNFILDTGNSDMVVDSRLAAELKLPNAGDSNVLGVERREVAPVVRLDSVGMGGASARHVNSCVMRQVPFGARGVIGEGFLKNFDLFIDNRRQVIEFESGTGSLAERFDGERVPFITHGAFQGKITPRRIVVFAHIAELGDKEFKLLVDSGSDTLLLFTSLGANSRQRDFVTATSLEVRGATRDELPIRSLEMGHSRVEEVTVVAPWVIPASDVDGLLPTSLFRSIFISHSGEFVILNPTVKLEISQVKH